MFPVLAVELDFSAVDESHEFVEGPGFLDGVHGAEGCDFLGDVGGVFRALFGLVFLDGHSVFSLVSFYQLTRGLTQSI